MKLKHDFYLREDVVAISKDLLGKYLFTNIRGKLTGGIITETEAYHGETDRASHAFGGRRTPRTETMYAAGGRAYIYLCYGIHHLFNVVTNREGVPHAVLIRAIKPEEGLETILRRRKMKILNKRVSGGPGTVSSSLSITTQMDGTDLSGNTIWIEDRGIQTGSRDILSGPRIGVDYAGADARKPWRFRLKDG